MKNYPKHYETINKAMEEMGLKIPEIMTAFGELHEKSVEDGALSSKVKELISLGIAITVRCDGCITFHVHDALTAGATDKEIMETIGVAISMGGGPSVVYGSEAMEALKQFRAMV